MAMLSSSTSMRCNTNKKKVSCGTPSPPRTGLSLLCSTIVRTLSLISLSQLQGAVVIVGITTKYLRARPVLILISCALSPYALNITSVSSQSGRMSCGSFNVTKGGRFSAPLLQTALNTWPY
ncbi:hypothetical protein J3E69DRAFT_327455 [Trichoderma sp. SZMC 28015]